jgi:hypothetical protein
MVYMRQFGEQTNDVQFSSCLSTAGQTGNDDGTRRTSSLTLPVDSPYSGLAVPAGQPYRCRVEDGRPSSSEQPVPAVPDLNLSV